MCFRHTGLYFYAKLHFRKCTADNKRHFLICIYILKAELIFRHKGSQKLSFFSVHLTLRFLIYLGEEYLLAAQSIAMV